MAGLLSKLFDKLVEVVHKIKFKIDIITKNANHVELNTKFFECCCEYTNVKDDLK